MKPTVESLFFVDAAPESIGKEQLWLLAPSDTPPVDSCRKYSLVKFDKKLLHVDSPALRFVRAIPLDLLDELGVDTSAARARLPGGLNHVIKATLVDIPARSFKEFVSTPQEFDEFLAATSKLMIKEKQALANSGILGWLGATEIGNKTAWRQIAPMLTPMETRAISFPVFAKADRELPTGNYPTDVSRQPPVNAPEYRNVKIGAGAKTIPAECWVSIFSRLRGIGANALCAEIAKTYLLSYHGFTEMLQPGVIEEISQAMLPEEFSKWYWYTARIMFLEELSTYRSGALKDCCAWREDDTDRPAATCDTPEDISTEQPEPTNPRSDDHKCAQPKVADRCADPISAETVAARTRLPRFILGADSVCGIAAAAGPQPIAPTNPHTPWSKMAPLAGNFISPAAISGARGVFPNAEIIARLGEFTGGVFSGVTWSGWYPGTDTSAGPTSAGTPPSQFRIAITGSTITACAIRNPLEEQLAASRKWSSPAAARNAFWEEYYPSKIGVVIYDESESSEDSGDIFDNGRDDLDVVPLVRGLQPPTPADKNAPTRKNKFKMYMPSRSRRRTPVVTPPESDSESEESDDSAKTGVGYSDIDVAVECSKGAFIGVVKQVFAQISARSSSALELVRIDTENFYRFRITGLRRDIELFHVYSIPAVVAKFHLAEVRAWFDGVTTWTFPTFVGAACSGISADIRWTSNRKNVRDIVLKYHQRGFGILLCDADAASLQEHIMKSDLWKGMHAKSSPSASLPRWRYRRIYASNPFKHVSAINFNPSLSGIGIYKNIKRPVCAFGIKFTEPSTSSYNFAKKKRGTLLMPAPY